jgi:hypothetical protein
MHMNIHIMAYSHEVHEGHDSSDSRYCTVSFETPYDRKKALHELTHVIHANFSGIGNRRIVISRDVCEQLSKNIKMQHMKKQDTCG